MPPTPRYTPKPERIARRVPSPSRSPNEPSVCTAWSFFCGRSYAAYSPKRLAVTLAPPSGLVSPVGVSTATRAGAPGLPTSAVVRSRRSVPSRKRPMFGPTITRAGSVPRKKPVPSPTRGNDSYAPPLGACTCAVTPFTAKASIAIASGSPRLARSGTVNTAVGTGTPALVVAGFGLGPPPSTGSAGCATVSRAWPAAASGSVLGDSAAGGPSLGSAGGGTDGAVGLPGAPGSGCRFFGGDDGSPESAETSTETTTISPTSGLRTSSPEGTTSDSVPCTCTNDTAPMRKRSRSILPVTGSRTESGRKSEAVAPAAAPLM